MSGYATISELDPKVKEPIEDSLFNGEEFLGAIDCSRDGCQTTLVLTDERVIDFRQGVIRQSITDHDRGDVMGSSFEKGLLNSTISMEGADFEKSFQVDQKPGRRFVAALKNSESQDVFESPDTNENATERNDRRVSEQKHSPASSQASKDTPRDRMAVKRWLQAMDNYDFEHLVADLWTRRGWETAVSQASVDAGIDVRATKEDPYPQKKLIQAKRYAEGNTVGSKSVQQYASLKQQEDAVDSVVVVTTSSFTSHAEDRASDLNVKLVDGDDLVTMIENIGAYDLLDEHSVIPNQKATNAAPSQGTGFGKKSTKARNPTHDVENRVSEASATSESTQERHTLASEETPTQSSSESEGLLDIDVTRENWHYGVAAGGLLQFAGLYIEPTLVFGLGMAAVLIATYADIQYVKPDYTWRPRTKLYLVGTVFLFFISVPAHLIQRYRHAEL